MIKLDCVKSKTNVKVNDKIMWSVHNSARGLLRGKVMHTIGIGVGNNIDTFALPIWQFLFFTQ